MMKISLKGNKRHCEIGSFQINSPKHVDTKRCPCFGVLSWPLLGNRLLRTATSETQSTAHMPLIIDVEYCGA